MFYNLCRCIPRSFLLLIPEMPTPPMVSSHDNWVPRDTTSLSLFRGHPRKNITLGPFLFARLDRMHHFAGRKPSKMHGMCPKTRVDCIFFMRPAPTQPRSCHPKKSTMKFLW